MYLNVYIIRDVSTSLNDVDTKKIGLISEFVISQKMTATIKSSFISTMAPLYNQLVETSAQVKFARHWTNVICTSCDFRYSKEAEQAIYVVYAQLCMRLLYRNNT